MIKLKFVLICHFGLEKVLKQEVRKLGLEICDVTDGEVKVWGGISDIPRLNFNLRTCERVMIEINNFNAVTFEELFYNVKNSQIEDFVPVDGEFIITKANQDKNSILHSSTSIQSITKKAMVERLKFKYKTNVLNENRGKYPFRVKFNKNNCSLRLDTTGDSLHKRGYRIKSGLAPIEETLAAALVKLVEFNNNKVLIDPFCGSGTIPIEAAMISMNMPPSIDRAFVSETWDVINPNMWSDARDEAIKLIRKNDDKISLIKIFGFDIDSKMIEISKGNALRAGASDNIHFETCSIRNLIENNTFKKIINISTNENNDVIILCNPPYGERLEDKNKVELIYRDLQYFYEKTNNINLHLITSYDRTEAILGKATKNRKIYNGMIKTYLYSYLKNEQCK